MSKLGMDPLAQDLWVENPDKWRKMMIREAERDFCILESGDDVPLFRDIYPRVITNLLAAVRHPDLPL